METTKIMECDVCVVGGGNAGLVAAIEAANSGIKALVIEKAPKERRGGNSRFTGAVWRFSYDRGLKDLLPLVEGTTLPAPVDKIDVEPYTRDMFYKDMMRVSEGLAEKKWTEMIVEQSLPVMYWMKQQGAQFEFTSEPMVKRGDRVFFPAGDNVLQSVNIGEGLVESLFAIAAAKKIPVMYDTAGCSLIVNKVGEVCGIMAKSPEGMIQINTPNVILACGGFESNPEMRRRYLGEGWDLAKLRGTHFNSGDGIIMAIEIGAQTFGHWGGCHASVVSEDSPMVEAQTVMPSRYSYMYGISVNVNGERFVDEGEDLLSYTYAKMGRQIVRQPQSLAFQIFDARVSKILTPRYQNVQRVESNSLEELAENAGINVKGFLNTVKEFNNAVVEDKPFQKAIRDGRRTRGLKVDKSNWAQKIDTPPYLAYAVVPGLTFSYGGLKISEKAEVLDTSDRPIKGLYAAGEVPGGLFYHNYASGTGLVKGSVTGRIAASEAVARVKGKR